MRRNYIPTNKEFPSLGEVKIIGGHPCFEAKTQVYQGQGNVLEFYEFLNMDTPRISGKIMSKEATEQEIRRNLLVEVKSILKNVETMGFQVGNHDEVSFYLLEHHDISERIVSICETIKQMFPEVKSCLMKISHDREDPTDRNLTIVLLEQFSEAILQKLNDWYKSDFFDFLSNSNGWVQITQVR